jgi:hypothetical protein
MESIQIRGGGKLRCRAEVWDGGVTLRIDDDARPDFWAEVTLDCGDLADLHADARACLTAAIRDAFRAECP